MIRIIIIIMITIPIMTIIITAIMFNYKVQ
jgi:hypothetical protein